MLVGRGGRVFVQRREQRALAEAAFDERASVLRQCAVTPRAAGRPSFKANVLKGFRDAFGIATRKTVEIEFSKLVEDSEKGLIYTFVQYRREKAYLLSAFKQRIMVYCLGAAGDDFALRCAIGWRALRQRLGDGAAGDSIANFFAVSNWRSVKADILIVLKSGKIVFLDFFRQNDLVTNSYKLVGVWEPNASPLFDGELVLAQTARDFLILCWKRSDGYSAEFFAEGVRGAAPPKLTRVFSLSLSSQPFKAIRLSDHRLPFGQCSDSEARPTERLYREAPRWLFFTQTGIVQLYRLRPTEAILSQLLALAIASPSKATVAAFVERLSAETLSGQFAFALLDLLTAPSSRAPYVVSLNLFDRGFNALFAEAGAAVRTRMLRARREYLFGRGLTVVAAEDDSQLATAKESYFFEGLRPAADGRFEELLANCLALAGGGSAEARREFLAAALAPLWANPLFDFREGKAVPRLSGVELFAVIDRLARFERALCDEKPARFTPKKSVGRSASDRAECCALAARATQILFLVEEALGDASRRRKKTRSALAWRRARAPFGVLLADQSFDVYLSEIACEWALAAEHSEERLNKATKAFGLFFNENHFAFVEAIIGLQTETVRRFSPSEQRDNSFSLFGDSQRTTSDASDAADAAIAKIEALGDRLSPLSVLRLLPILGELRRLSAFFEIALKCICAETPNDEARALKSDFRRVLLFVVLRLAKCVDEREAPAKAFGDVVWGFAGLQLSPRARSAAFPRLLGLGECARGGDPALLAFLGGYKTAELGAAFSGAVERLLGAERETFAEIIPYVLRAAPPTRLPRLGPAALDRLAELPLDAAAVDALLAAGEARASPEGLSQLAERLALNPANALGVRARVELLARAAPSTRFAEARASLSAQLALKERLEESGQSSAVVEADIAALDRSVLSPAQLHAIAERYSAPRALCRSADDVYAEIERLGKEERNEWPKNARRFLNAQTTDLLQKISLSKLVFCVETVNFSVFGESSLAESDSPSEVLLKSKIPFNEIQICFAYFELLSKQSLPILTFQFCVGFFAALRSAAESEGARAALSKTRFEIDRRVAAALEIAERRIGRGNLLRRVRRNGSFVRDLLAEMETSKENRKLNTFFVR